MKKYFNLMCILLLSAGCTCCKSGDEPGSLPDATVIDATEKAIVTGAEGVKKFVTVTANASWSLKAQDSWIQATPQSASSGTSTVTVTVDPFANATARSSEVIITSTNGVAQLSIPVFQMASQDDLLVSPTKIPDFAKEAASLKLVVACNNEYTVSIEDDSGWVTEQSSASISDQVREYLFGVAANDGRSRSTKIVFTQKVSGDKVSVTVTQNGVVNIPDKDGATVKGEVTCEGKPVEGVVVSDGFEVTTTDKDGFYWLKSAKKNGYVFITIPGGYMVDSSGGIPQFWQATTKAAGTVEVLSFRLRSEPNKDHILLATTDTHMANRQNYNPYYNDTYQYRNDFVKSVDSFVQANSDKAVYAICLGDLTWDIYWYDKGTNYTLESYRQEIADFPVSYFQVIGNHDYDMKYSDNFQATAAFRRIIGPTYYSFNLGDVHYVVLDNMVYINNNEDRSHNTYVDEEQLAWLRKDLAYVDKQKPVFVCMHCPAYDISGVSDNKISVVTNFTYPNQTSELGDCFKGFADVHYLSGHTHLNRAIANEDMPVGYQNIFEHNIGAVCATWWWTGYISKNSICKDGSEGGYMVFSNNGSDVSWRWKGMKVADEKQFRTYDMNVIKNYFVTDDSAKAYSNVYPGRTRYAYCAENTVYINVWNWDSGWTISVKENGVDLAVRQVRDEDPLHTLSYDIPRTASNGSLTSSFRTYSTTHIFAVEAAGAASTLDVVVADRFGKTYSERMVRPKQFSIGMD